MSVILQKPIPRSGPMPANRPGNKIWTVPQFHFLGDLGMFEGCRAMLINGAIIEEGPMNPPHRTALEVSTEAIRSVFGSTRRVCVQMPLVFGLTTDPEPDIAVVAGSARGSTTHPTTADLIVEISDTSLSYDTNEKMSLYASARIADYWVVDVIGRKLLVYRDPIQDSTAPHGSTYSTQKSFSETDSVTPFATPNSTVKVSDLLP